MHPDGCILRSVSSQSQGCRPQDCLERFLHFDNLTQPTDMSRLCFCSVLILLSCYLPHAATADLIVDNFSESGGGGYGLNSSFFGNQKNKVAQQFNTGGRDMRLVHASVIVLRDQPVPDFTAELWSSDAFERPDTLLGTLTLANNPLPNGFNEYLFRADGVIQLDGQSNYFFAVQDNADGSTSALAGSVFGSNNSTGPGNVLENVWRLSDGSPAWVPFGTNAALIKIVGNPEPGSLLMLSAIAGGFMLRRRRV